MAPTRDDRAKKAKTTINKTIPALLKGNPRARQGVESAELIVEPPPPPSTANQDGAVPTVSIRVLASDTLAAAAKLRGPRIAVLNMASPLRPGGGVLTGATSQEESLCCRTTLYPSLKESFYRLPEIGVVYTPDVLVFRDPNEEDLDKEHMFYIDVITAAMLRFPDVEGEGDATRYAEEKNREVAVRKMRTVMRVLRMKGANGIVLGAWGCGAYGNPVGEIARAWKRVLLGKGKSRTPEIWEGLEVVFAVKDLKMAQEFAGHFQEGLELDVLWTG